MCKHAQQDHEELNRRQRRLDARGNDIEAANRESDWAIGLAKNLPEDGLALVNTHIVGLTKRFPSRTMQRNSPPPSRDSATTKSMHGSSRRWSWITPTVSRG